MSEGVFMTLQLIIFSTVSGMAVVCHHDSIVETGIMLYFQNSLKVEQIDYTVTYTKLQFLYMQICLLIRAFHLETSIIHMT